MNINVKPITIQLLKKIGENLWDLRVDKEFLDLIPKVQNIKGKKCSTGIHQN